METIEKMRSTVVAENSDFNELNQIFDQICAYNEIGYQTMFLAINAALESLKSKADDKAVAMAMIKLNELMQRCLKASDKIELLAKKGQKVVDSSSVEC